MQPASETASRSGLLIWMAVAGFLALGVGELWLLQEVKALRADREQLTAQVAAQAERIETLNDAATANRPTSTSPATSPIADPVTQQRISQLEQRLQAITPSLVATAANEPPPRSSVPEYNVLNPPAAEPSAPEPAPEPPPEDKIRGWGEEQVVGPPNVFRAHDDPAAWASQTQDGQPEWLSVQFARIVDIAELRVRECYNPGAISKVSAHVNGQEYVLWEGVAHGGPAPRDFVVPVQRSIQASAITIYIDSPRVPGWNEIDAVELVGKDGSRQWAAAVRASSTYAPSRTSQLDFSESRR